MEKKKNVMYMAMELANGGELFEYVANTGKFSEEVCRTYFHQLIEALEFLHLQGFTHRDIKPENLLLDDKFLLKIADFGFATILDGKDGTGLLHTFLGTDSYMAPEILMKKSYKGQEVDLFASAIVLFIMYSGNPPFSKADMKDPYYKLIMNNKVDVFWKAHEKFKPKSFYSSEFKEFLSKMFECDPAKRLSMAEIKKHPWYLGKCETLENVFKEFTQRNSIVVKELEKERIRKEIEKQKKMEEEKQLGSKIYTGIKGFRSVSEVYKDDFKNLLIEYPNLNLERKVYNREKGIEKKNDLLSIMDADYYFKLILKILKEYKPEQENQMKINDILISDKKYKIKVIALGDISNIEFDIKISKVDEETCCAEFTRRSGSSLNYFNIIQEIKKKVKQD